MIYTINISSSSSTDKYFALSLDSLLWDKSELLSLKTTVSIFTTWKNQDNCNMIQTFIIVSIEYEINKARMIEYDCTVSRRRHVEEMRLS